MIVVHCFKRTIKDKTWLMADSSATSGASPAFGQPVQLFEIQPAEKRSLWIRKATHIVKTMYDGEKVSLAEPNPDRRNNTQVFDLVVGPINNKSESHGLLGKLKEKLS